MKDLKTPSGYCPLQGGLELFISGEQSSSVLEMMLAGMISSSLGLDLSFELLITKRLMLLHSSPAVFPIDPKGSEWPVL